MNREKLIKDLTELYIGQNPNNLFKKYNREKQKQMILIIAGGMIICLLCFVNDKNNSMLEKESKIIRNEMQEGKENIILEIKTKEEDWKEIEFTLYPKEYTQEEIEALFVEAAASLEENIRKGNESLQCVTSDLELIQQMEGFPFTIQWLSTPEGIIDENGSIVNPEKNINTRVQLKAIFSWEDWQKEKNLWVHVIKEEPVNFLASLKQQLEIMEADTRKNKEFSLPNSFQDQNLQWRYPQGNTALILFLLLCVAVPVLSYQKDQDIHRQTIKRNQQLQESFSEFITKLTLLLEAGLNSRSAIFHIAEEYQRKAQGKKQYLYEELSYICRQMKNGMSEKEGYELLAKRCALPCYKKISGMLIQHLYKGGNHIVDELKKEAIKAGEEQKRNLQKKGEEMGTKLLFPMILMLGIVMVFIMVPALFSFQV